MNFAYRMYYNDGEGVQNETDCFHGGKYRIGSKVEYFCDAYYILRGPHIRTCGKDQEWTRPTPFCEPGMSSLKYPFIW